MRKFVSILRDIRKKQLVEYRDNATTPEEKAVAEKSLAEADAKFGWISGQIDGTQSLNSNERLAEVMTSADFTYAILEFVQRKTLPGYERKRFAFEPLVYNDQTPNFLPVTRYQNRCGVDDLELVTEKGQARPGTVQDATKRQWQVYRWEKQYDFSYEALKNDDIGYFENVAALMGEAARRTLEKFVSRMYTNALSIAQLTGAGALYSTTGRLTSGRISTARMAFNQRTDACSEPINASLNFAVIHSGLVDTARTIQASQLVPELATNAANVVRTGWQWIEDPYITGTAPNLPWWAFSGPGNGLFSLVLARMAGMPGPMIVRKKSDIEAVTSMLGAGRPVDPILGDFESGNITLKVMDVFGTYVSSGANISDINGAYYSAGTAP
jgi:hypothetical protein